jgi:hypothetical protein
MAFKNILDSIFFKTRPARTLYGAALILILTTARDLFNLRLLIRCVKQQIRKYRGHKLEMLVVGPEPCVIHQGKRCQNSILKRDCQTVSSKRE